VLRWVARAREHATRGDTRGGPVLYDFRDTQGHCGDAVAGDLADAAREMAFAVWAEGRRRFRMAQPPRAGGAAGA